MSREEAAAKLKVAADKVEALESLLEIERLTARHATGHDPGHARELKAHLEKAAIEHEEARRQLDRLTTGASETELTPEGPDA